MVKCAVLVVAAGRGRRFGGDIPKQYLDLGGRTVLRHSLATFAAHPRINWVRTVIHPDDRELYDASAHNLKILEPVHGGETRQDSVRFGLESLAEYNPDVVLIHDGARPMIDAGTISRVITALETQDGVIPALPVADTLKRGQDGLITQTVDRANLWRAQTPQGFKFQPILSAHLQTAGKELTDDAAVLEHSGGKVALVLGTEENLKITTMADLARVSSNTSGPGDFRTGNGFDVHAFEEGDGVWLCGVKVPHTQGLKGHSDADVAMHALTDAILGAISAGDIGHHFPPSEVQWKGCESHVFLKHAVNLVQGLGGKITHVDVTIICERPKVGPYRPHMQSRLSELLEINESRISVKATTTEGLGFTGRQEGIAAQATATIWLP
jgi:2-C-methyl-D-erythritol 4-phosphate cytidylyltransferase/2-C-methyl-D-erythritol 2,4-cyclodiphosphate synthase